MKLNPLVSIVIPCFNVEKYIEETVNSVIQQDYKNLEIIIIDDGSTDKTREVIKRIEKKDKRIKKVFKENEGVSVARNLGITISNGEYISFLDGDDILLGNKISSQMNKIKKSGAKVCFCYNAITYLDKTNIKKKNIFKKEKKILREYILQKAYITTNDWIIEKDFIIKNDLKFGSEFKYGEDFNFFMKVITLTEVASTGKISTLYRINSDSSSFRKNIRVNLKENYINEYIDWTKENKTNLYSNKELEEIKYLLINFLMPQVFIRNIEYNKTSRNELTNLEKEVIANFKFNINNIKASIKYYWLYIKCIFR